VYFLLKARAGNNPSETTETPVSTSFLVQEIDNPLVSIRIFDHEYHIIEIQRNPAGFWDITLPGLATADQALASEAETQINALEISTIIDPVNALSDYGLEFPAYTIKLNYSNAVEHKIEVGASTPTGSGYYVQLDDKAVYIVSQYSLDAVTSLISNPPYPPTVTPSPTLDLPTSTPTQELPSPTSEAAQPTP
jgi:hypothetical protein